MGARAKSLRKVESFGRGRTYIYEFVEDSTRSNFDTYFKIIAGAFFVKK